MRRKSQTDFEYLGVYVLPATTIDGTTGRPWRSSALVVLHLEFSESAIPGVRDGAAQGKSSAGRPVTTAMLIIGKKEEIDREAGTYEVVLAKGVSQPRSKK